MFEPVPQTLPDKVIRKIFTNLQKFIRTSKNLTPPEVIEFLKSQGVTTPDELKFFIGKANQIAQRMFPDEYSKKQKQAQAFGKLPRWAQYGASVAGFNPAQTSKLG